MSRLKSRFLLFPQLFIMMLISFCSLTLEARLVDDPMIKDARHVDLAEKSLLLSITQSGSRIFVAGERGHILYSDNEGKTWQQAHVPTRVTLTGLFFVSDNEGWAVGHDATILHTIDAGLNWEVQFFDPDLDQPLMSLIAQKNTAQDGYEINAVGAYGYFLNSQDSGKSWHQKIISAEDAHLNKIIQISQSQHLIVGEFGYVYKSQSDGTWHFIKTPYQGSFFGVIAPKGHEYFVYGLRGSLYLSSDEGEKWQRINTDTTSSLFGGIMLSDGRIVIVGASGVLLIGDDSTNRRFHKHVFPDRKANSHVIQVSPTEIMIVGEGGIKKFDLSEIGG